VGVHGGYGGYEVNFFYHDEPDCTVLHWPLYPFIPVLWVIGVVGISIALLFGLLDN